MAQRRGGFSFFDVVDEVLSKMRGEKLYKRLMKSNSMKELWCSGLRERRETGEQDDEGRTVSKTGFFRRLMGGPVYVPTPIWQPYPDLATPIWESRLDPDLATRPRSGNPDLGSRSGTQIGLRSGYHKSG
ncbi:unnamed protein product [Phytophthora lilii]|uniref:Unnamed protein product n=1 Tax=Phytophthora lilii TaxID=2077276 RepID=A0A9W6XES0_9STRA|nr:unnamed protein product [Phytophthora lilii]